MRCETLIFPKKHKKEYKLRDSTCILTGGDAGFVANKVCVIAKQRRTQCFLNRLCAPFPHGYTVSRGVPGISHKRSVYAQRFVASNNATHSCDKSHNRWLCPLRSISANASACFSLRLRSARVPGFTLQSNGTAFAVQNPHFGIKKEQPCCSFFGGKPVTQVE